MGAIAEFRPTLIITTHAADTHSDHRTAFELCATALERLNRAAATHEWAVQCRLYTFLVHFGGVAGAFTLSPRTASGASRQLERRGCQLACGCAKSSRMCGETGFARSLPFAVGNHAALSARIFAAQRIICGCNSAWS